MGLTIEVDEEAKGSAVTDDAQANVDAGQKRGLGRDLSVPMWLSLPPPQLPPRRYRAGRYEGQGGDGGHRRGWPSGERAGC